MGVQSSKRRDPLSGGRKVGGVLPQDATPYQGPGVSYRFVQADVTTTTIVGISQTKSTSNQQSYYPALRGPYSEGFTLVQFLPIPGATSMRGMSGSKMKYEAIYSKSQIHGETEHWNLRIDHCQVNIRSIRPGMFSTSSASQGDSASLISRVLEVTGLGGRLVCLTSTMAMTTGGVMQAVGTEHNVVIGVDVIFNIPLEPSPKKYCYTAVNMPLTFQSGNEGLVNTSTETQGDWEGTLNSHLSKGWRLVDVFLDMANAASSMQGMTNAEGGINTIWFFEKTADSIQDFTAKYEGIIIDYNQQIRVGIGGAKLTGSWVPTITEMGSRGWELASIVTTPGSASSGMKMSIKLKLIFQRKLTN